MTKRPILTISRAVPPKIVTQLAVHVDVQIHKGDILLPESDFDASYGRDVLAADQLRRATVRHSASTPVYPRAGETVDRLGERLNKGEEGPLPIIE